MVLVNLPTFAKWRWIRRLAEAADSREPIAYVVAMVCVAILIFVVISVIQQWYNYRKGEPLEGGLFKNAIGALIAISMPILLLCELVPRLLK